MLGARGAPRSGPERERFAQIDNRVPRTSLPSVYLPSGDHHQQQTDQCRHPYPLKHGDAQAREPVLHERAERSGYKVSGVYQAGRARGAQAWLGSLRTQPRGRSIAFVRRLSFRLLGRLVKVKANDGLASRRWRCGRVRGGGPLLGAHRRLPAPQTSGGARGNGRLLASLQPTRRERQGK
jgi:hypothetical protein